MTGGWGARAPVQAGSIVNSEMAELLRPASPYAVEVRYPNDAPEILSGGEDEALAAARRVQETVQQLFGSYLDA